MEEARRRELLTALVSDLASERDQQVAVEDMSADELWPLFRALVNTRPPEPASEGFLTAQDELLKGLIADAGVSTIVDATPSPTDSRLLLWHGDITTLAVDAIVNAANSQMLGCWVPGHHCIDNAIHTFAGVQLRLECAKIMAAQGHEEPTATAKVTGAWNLPAKRIIHTVGPIAAGRPTARHRAQLARCYESCLDAAVAEDLRTIAFCCIGTGVFGFPARDATPIAVRTVQRWLDAHSHAATRVVFNVFSASDEALYREELGIAVDMGRR